VLQAVTEGGAEPWVHACAAGVPWALLRGAGARGLSVDQALLTAADLDQVAEALEAGESVALGLVPALDPSVPPTDPAVSEAALRWLDLVGADPAEVGDRLALTPACGLAGASPEWARTALQLLAAAARNLTD
jgi:methionine synthase II (cobalamin-independent)